MANRYWVGGTGNWSDTTHWSTASGGAGGASLPTSVDDVYFNANSGTGTCTVDIVGTCLSLICTGYTGLMNNAGTINVYGSITLSPNISTGFNNKGYNLRGTGTYNLTPNGNGLNLGFYSTGTYNLQGPCGFGQMAPVSGTLNTNGYDVDFMSIWDWNATSFTINFSTSNVYFRVPGDYLTSPKFNFNLTNATISTNSALNYGTRTVKNIYLASFYNSTVYGNVTVTGTLSFTPYPVNDGYPCSCYIGGTFNCGTFSANGAGYTARLLITGGPINASSVSLSYVDFADCTLGGTATWSGTSIGRFGTITGTLNATPAKTVYWNLPAGGDFKASNGWATTSNGTPALANYPLPQDTAVITDAGLSSGSTININSGSNSFMVMPTFNFSSRTLPATIGFYKDVYLTSNLNVPTNITIAGSGNLISTSNMTITTNGATISPSISVSSNTTVTFSGPFTTTGGISNSGIIPSATITCGGFVNNGNFTLGGNCTAATLTTGASSTTAFGSNKFTVTGSETTVISLQGTMTGTPVIETNYSGATGTRTISSIVPNSTIKVISGTDTVALTNAGNIDFTGFSGTISNDTRSIYGYLVISATCTLSSGTNTTTFTGSGLGGYTIETNGKILDFPLVFNGVNCEFILNSNLTQGSTRTTTLTNGTLNLNGKTFTIGQFVTAAGTKNITFNGGVLSIPAVTTTAFNNAQPTGFTTTLGTGSGKISLTGSAAKTFVGGGSTYNCTVENAGAGALTITGSNTINTLSNSVQPTSFIFTSGTTQTVTNFNVSGTPGNLVTITASSTSNATLSKSSGTVRVSYCNISKSTATGGASWQAPISNGNINSGSNTGWLFTSIGNGLLFGSNF